MSGSVGNGRVAAALAEAATAAGYAPSIHNTQPWRWRVQADSLELHSDQARRLPATDPDGRLLIISCGAALHHARVALAAEGWTCRVERLPGDADPDLLARILPHERGSVTPAAMRLVQAMQLRRTNRRPASTEPVPQEALEAIRGAATGEGVDLHVLTGDQLADLAAAAARASDVEARDEDIQAELAYWTGREHPAGTGLPAEVLPASRPQTEVPGRDFGRVGTLPIGPGHDRYAAFAVLFGDSDDPIGWLRAGEALSAAWLRATEEGVTVLPFSGVVEVPSTRQALRRTLAGLGYPYLVLRIGIADPDHAGPPHTPRLPADQVVDASAVRPG